jgi:hypothetical protein
VGWILEATLLIPSNIFPPRYEWIYYLLLRLLGNLKQYEVMISDYLVSVAWIFFHDGFILRQMGAMGAL